MQGSEMRGLRKTMGLSQAELADAISLTPKFVGMMERGEAPIDPRTAMAVQRLGLARLSEEELRKRFRQAFDTAGGEGRYVVVDRQMWERQSVEAMLSLVGSARVAAGPFADRDAAEAEAGRLNDA